MQENADASRGRLYKSAIKHAFCFHDCRVSQDTTVLFYRCSKSRDWTDKLADGDQQNVRNAVCKDRKNAWAFVRSVLKENGIDVSVSLPKQEVKEHPFLSPDEVLKFIGLLDGEDVAIPAMLGLHSLRKSEIIALDWKDVDLQSKTIYVHSADVMDENGNLTHKKTTKNATSTRTIPIIIPSLYSALCAVEDKTGKVCTMYHGSIYKAVNRICEQNGLPLIGVHGLRHSAVSLLYALGVSEAASMRICGYADWGTMRKIYTHLDSSAINDVKAKAEQFFA